jgi:4-amino-4-deoxy-L-arabinose transferase-like glycosyltransferase
MMLEIRSKQRVVAFAVASLLALMAFLSGGAALKESVAVDEVAHLGAGVSYLQKLDLRLNEEHPPLAKVLAALPLVLRGAHADYSNRSWSFSSKMFNGLLGEWAFGHWVITSWNDPYSTMLWARAPMLVLTLLLGYVIYVCGSRLGGSWGGLLSLCAYATMPAFLAFGPLVLTDVPVTLFSLLALWAFAAMWKAPARATSVKFGFALAAALLSKFSAGLLFVFFGAFILSLRWRPVPDMPGGNSERRIWRRKRWRYLALGTALAALTVYAVYLVLSWNEPSDSLQLLHVPASPFLRRLLMPPWIFLRGLASFALMSSRPTFIIGHSYPHGVWFYFPILFLLKSPLVFIGLLLVALGVATVGRRRLAQLNAIPPGLDLHWRAVWVFLLVYTAACMLSRLDISIRHFSIPLVLLILLLAPLPRTLASLQNSGWPAARAMAGLTVLLAATSIVAAVRAYPYYFPFVNSLSLGRPAYALVNDSNLDWNQSLPDVARFVRQRGIQRVLIDEYGFSEPTVYVPQSQFWNCQQPSPSDLGQWAVVSADMLQDGHNCLWLLQYPHETLAGGSMYAFRLPAEIPPAGALGGPPLPRDYRQFGGIAAFGDFRLVLLNCIRDPQQLDPTMQKMIDTTNAATKNKNKK